MQYTLNMQQQRVEYVDGSFESFASIGCYGWDKEAIIEQLEELAILDDILS